MTLQPGQTIGRYQIIEPLGVGGMATVYKAFQPSLEREVALKVLRPGFADDPEFFERFQREARSIARLRHPNIVQVFDFEPLDGRYVLAMEYLEGGTLKERVTSLAARGERLTHKEVARIVGEVGAALGYGHELGIVHRDVKPSNVMLSERGRAVVTDFGIAKIMGGESHTQTGVGIGTPEYMAPEQGTGAKVDHRADIYSLGVMAYEMLTGRVPFTADTPLAIVLAHMRDPLPLPTTIDPSIPPASEHVLMKALAKEPADRYESATDFADALRDSLVPAPATAATVYAIPPAAGAATTAVTPAPGLLGGIPRTVLIGGALLVLLVLAGTAFALTRGTTPAEVGGIRSTPTPAGVAAPGPVGPGPGQSGGPQGPGCGVPGTNLPSCPPGQTNPAGTAAPTSVIPRGALLFEWKTGDALTSLAIERTGSASTESTTGGLRVVVGSRPEDSAKISLPVPSRQAYVVEYDLQVAGDSAMAVEFALRAGTEGSFRLVLDGAMLARVYEDPGQKVIAGPGSVGERTAGQPRFLLTIRIGEDSQATVYVNGGPVLPGSVDLARVNNQQPVSMRLAGSGHPNGGTVDIKAIRLYAAN